MGFEKGSELSIVSHKPREFRGRSRKASSRAPETRTGTLVVQIESYKSEGSSETSMTDKIASKTLLPTEGGWVNRPKGPRRELQGHRRRQCVCVRALLMSTARSVREPFLGTTMRISGKWTVSVPLNFAEGVNSSGTEIRTQPQMESAQVHWDGEPY